ncbi:glycosyltransferase [Micromonospora sp. WMMD1082]|uniref:glycosyltransferase n=1 Tax=Micromonospora sp. WMMD1082 TaxID=3016104 RepID=UPI002417AB78|nr:glycosyltransferase [Micromonospora sp. WMMD1082]MDG4793695.1 glycosyltransferase [Micromonospora sp. WMMD1082]
MTQTILHYLTQWMWLSDSFVHGPIAASRYRATVVSRMPVTNSHVYPPPAGLISLDSQAPAEGAAAASAVISRLDGSRPVLVHLHHGYCLPDASALARALDIPLVVSFWGYDVTALPRKEPKRLMPLLTALDMAVVPSRFLAEIVRNLGIEPARIRVVPGSVEQRFFDPTPLPAEPRVTFIGRFVPKKGIDVLLAAWPLVRKAVPGAELTLLGYGDGAPSSDPKSGLKVHTPDPIDPRGQVLSLIRRCRVYVSPSTTGPDGDSESQHIGNIEAQAAGRVVVTTNHGAIPEFIENELTGIVVAEGDHAALAAALIAALSDSPRWQTLSNNAATAARRFEVERIREAHAHLYAELIQGGKY